MQFNFEALGSTSEEKFECLARVRKVSAINTDLKMLIFQKRREDVSKETEIESPLLFSFFFAMKKWGEKSGSLDMKAKSSGGS